MRNIYACGKGFLQSDQFYKESFVNLWIDPEFVKYEASVSVTSLNDVGFARLVFFSFNVRNNLELIIVILNRLKCNHLNLILAVLNQ